MSKKKKRSKLVEDMLYGVECQIGILENVKRDLENDEFRGLVDSRLRAVSLNLEKLTKKGGRLK